MRPLGAEDELKLRLRPGAERVAGFSFLREVTFTERDRVVLDVLAGHLARRRARAARSPSIPRADVDLTEREWDVLTLVATGKTNKEIGALLLISADTVRTHLQNVFTKLGVHTRTAAVAKALPGRRG